MMLSHVIRRALADIRENGLTHVLSMGTIAAAFFLFGCFSLLSHNFEAFLDIWEKKVQIVLFIQRLTPEPRILVLQENIRQEQGVRSVRYVSRADAMESFRRELSGYGGMLDGLQQDFFPASLEVTVAESHRTPERIRDLARRLEMLPDVEEAQYGGVWLERLSLALVLLKWGGWVLAGVLAMIIVSVTANTVRLTLYNKREEIGIMKLVGAPDSMVTFPFYVQAGLQGLIGAGASLVILAILYYLFSVKVSPYLSLYFGRVPLQFLSIGSIIGILGLGVCSGIVGGVFSLRRAEVGE